MLALPSSGALCATAVTGPWMHDSAVAIPAASTRPRRLIGEARGSLRPTGRFTSARGMRIIPSAPGVEVDPLGRPNLLEQGLIQLRHDRRNESLLDRVELGGA